MEVLLPLLRIFFNSVQILLSCRSLLLLQFEYAVVFLHGYISSLESTSDSFIIVTRSVFGKL
jgi:hypothetical protein